MKSSQEIITIAKNALHMEAAAVTGLIPRLNSDFAACVDLILNASGRVVVTGIGKSAHIAGKIVATFNSTGSPAIFMHAADAIHGDLGIVQEDDIVVCLSKSGQTPEIKALVPLVKARGHKLVAIVGNTDSYLAREADLVLDATVETEACPNNLAPTSSTTAQLALGDALAVCLLECRGFTQDDFAHLHPGGALGKKLYLRVDDLYKQNEKPMVAPSDDIRKVILEISGKRLGMTAVVENDRLLGIITDGDLRRMLERGGEMSGLTAQQIMTTSPKTVAPDELAIAALRVMEAHQITQLVVASDDRYMGVIHLHDLLKEGIL
ncbi:MAG: KpsF/GutQ family sugar-phosphate isomerase [Flavobacteriales bacterium]|nr:KpsF/GutQ family sugar-phosphate isomerase [Flavobacteriales bacterium]